MAGKVFQPRTPINRRDFFSGRWGELTKINDAVSEIGLHIVIYGERGVGKTSIANIIKLFVQAFDEGDEATPQDQPRLVVKINAASEDTFSSLWRKALDEIEFETMSSSIGFSPNEETHSTTLLEHFNLPDVLDIDIVRKILIKLQGSVFVFDEFDRMSTDETNPFTDLIKTLSDYAIDTTVILVGVSETVDNLVADHQSIARSLVQVPMPRMEPKDLREILQKAENALGMRFEQLASERIVQMSQGLPHYTHLVGQKAVRIACLHMTRVITTTYVDESFTQAIEDANQSVKTSYQNATHSSHPDALYEHVLLACAVTAYAGIDDQGFFQAAQIVSPLTNILGKQVLISTFNRHLTEFCEVSKRGGVLERKGKPRSYRYRFRDPLLPPFILMKGVTDGKIDEKDLNF